mgnify:CR=1 FL=1
MNILKKWKSGHSVSPFNDLKKILLNRSEEEKFAIINGTYLQLEEINPLQLILLWNEPIKYKKVFLKLFNLGASINKLSNKGINFIHMFLFLFYFSKNVQNEIDDCLELFMEFLKQGFNPSQTMCLPNISLTYVDLLISLQKNNENIKISNFIGRHNIKKDLEYKKLSNETFEKLMLLLLCYGVPFQYEHPLENLTWLTCEKYLSKHKVLQLYIKERFKLPQNIETIEVMKRVFFMIQYNKYLTLFTDKLDKKERPLCLKDGRTNLNFSNVNFVSNSQLQCYEYLPPLLEGEQIYYFHKSFASQLVSKKNNPFTRSLIDKLIIDLWKNFINSDSVHMFPLNDLSSINDNVYMFSDQKIDDANFYYRQSFNFIQEFFEIYHPYHQINRLYQLKKFEIQYISHVFYYETSILKKFVKCIKNPSISNLFKIMLYYCRKSNKYVSIMYFLMEEIFQDLACFEKLRPVITSLNDNYEVLFEQYLSRFDYFDTQYMNKFVENMLLIYRYQS